MERFEPNLDPGVERISEEEARAVVDRFLQQQSPDDPGVDVRTIAATLRLSEADVLRLLAETRQARLTSEQRKRSFRTRMRDSAVALVAGLVFLIAIGTGIAWYWASETDARTHAPRAYIDVEKFDISLGGARSEVRARANSLEIVKDADVKAIVVSTVEDLIAKELERTVWTPPKVDRRQLILAMEAGDYSSPALAHLPLTLQGGSRGRFAAGAKLPVYSSNDREIQEWLSNERRIRIEKALAALETSARAQSGFGR